MYLDYIVQRKGQQMSHALRYCNSRKGRSFLNLAVVGLKMWLIYPYKNHTTECHSWMDRFLLRLQEVLGPKYFPTKREYWLKSCVVFFSPLRWIPLNYVTTYSFRILTNYFWALCYKLHIPIDDRNRKLKKLSFFFCMTCI